MGRGRASFFISNVAVGVAQQPVEISYLFLSCSFCQLTPYFQANVVGLAAPVPVFPAALRLEDLGILAAVSDVVDAFVETMARNAITELLTARVHPRIAGPELILPLRERGEHQSRQLWVICNLTHAWPRARSAAGQAWCDARGCAGAISRARARARTFCTAFLPCPFRRSRPLLFFDPPAFVRGPGRCRSSCGRYRHSWGGRPPRSQHAPRSRSAHAARNSVYVTYIISY